MTAHAVLATALQRVQVSAHDHCDHCCQPRPGHWEWRRERVCVAPARWERVPVRVQGGRWVREGAALVWQGTEVLRWETRYLPPRYEWRWVQVWVPCVWTCRPCICHLPPWPR